MGEKKKNKQENIIENSENILTPELLRERAREYARTEETIQVLGEIKECLRFRLAREWFLVETIHIEKIVEPTRISRMPQQAEFVIGMMNLRGEVILIMDMALLVNLPGTKIQEHLRVIILKIGDVVTGFPVDEIVGAISLDTGRIQDSISTIKGIEAGFIKGLFKSEGEHFTWLDIEKVLSEMESRLFSHS